jgi:vesicle-fusing ATPase
MYDFDLALNEIKPAFGVDESDLSNSIRGGIVNHGERFNDVFKNCSDFVQEIKTSTTTPLLSILLEGSHGSGKTALAAKFALESKFPFVKIISPESFVGYSEGSKIQ